MSEYISECVLWMTPKPLGVERLCTRLNNILWKRGYSTLRYFPPPKSRIKHPRACGSSARRSLADASVSHRRTVVRPLQRMRLERDADDNRTALIAPSNARFTDLGMLVSRLTFIQQRSYDRRCRTSHSCQKQKLAQLEGIIPSASAEQDCRLKNGKQAPFGHKRPFRVIPELSKFLKLYSETAGKSGRSSP
jgi:hypothetical protein